MPKFVKILFLSKSSAILFSVIAAKPSGSREKEVTLKLWKEGFSIDDGPIRAYSDPEHKEFLDSIRRG